MDFAEMAVGGASSKAVGETFCGFERGGFGHFVPYVCDLANEGAACVPLQSQSTVLTAGGLPLWAGSVVGGSAVFGLRRREQALRILRYGQSFSRKKISPSRGLL